MAKRQFDGDMWLQIPAEMIKIVLVAKSLRITAKTLAQSYLIHSNPTHEAGQFVQDFISLFTVKNFRQVDVDKFLKKWVGDEKEILRIQAKLDADVFAHLSSKVKEEFTSDPHNYRKFPKARVLTSTPNTVTTNPEANKT